MIERLYPQRAFLGWHVHTRIVNLGLKIEPFKLSAVSFANIVLSILALEFET